MNLSQSQKAAADTIMTSIQANPDHPIVIESLSGMGKTTVIEQVVSRLGFDLKNRVLSTNPAWRDINDKVQILRHTKPDSREVHILNQYW